MIIVVSVLMYTPSLFMSDIHAISPTDELMDDRATMRAIPAGDPASSSDSSMLTNSQVPVATILQEEYVFVEEFAPDQQFANPDITIDKQTGNIFVADYFNQRVIKFDPNGNVITQWGSAGSADGQFQNPQDVAIDSSGNLYLTDTHNHRIQKFNNNGQFMLKWGTPGSGPGELAFPSRLAIDSNDILYVTDNGNGRVQKFNTIGQFVGTIVEGQLSFPVGIDVDSSDNVYVAESGAAGNPSRVDKFTSSGQPITLWGSLGSDPGQFNQPKGLTLDEDNNVYVADEFNNRIQKFDSNGNFITEFGQDRLNHTIDVAVDSEGQVYASDLDEILIYALSTPPSLAPPSETQCVGHGSGTQNIVGTNNDDTLIGGTGTDTIFGLAGRDAINGCAGHDRVSGNTDNDGIAGASGDDLLRGNEGNDLVQGGSGSDLVDGGDGDDTLTGGSGNDRFFCGPGNDIITDFTPGVEAKTADC
jgi:Ca2+-binding RTX toxin-like protein